MFKRTLLFLSMMVLVAVQAPLWADDPKARGIMQKVEDRDDGDNMAAKMDMILIDKNDNERHRVLTSKTKDFGEDTYRILFFLQPADVQGTGFLTYDYDDPDKDDDQWLYLPALHKIKRIATSDKSGSFMGSDFSYADMTDRDLEDYDYTLKKESEVRGHQVWIIEAVPNKASVIDETGYTKSLLLVRQDNYVVVRAVHWLDKGGKLKYMDMTGLEKIDGIWTPTEIHMTTKQNRITEHKTVLRFKDVKYHQSLDETLFTKRQLEKGP